jgi:hypothetical protein
VNHNAQTDGSPNQLVVTRELGPSKDPAKPSVYRVDLDPPEIPALTGSATEGIQRGLETLVSGADYSFVSGTIALTDSSIASYPTPNLAQTPQKVFASGGTAGASDFDNSSVILTRLGYSTNELFRYVAGPSASDYFNPAILSFTINTEPNISISRSTAGVTVNSAGLSTTRVGIADAAFTGSVFGDTNATRPRVEADRLYVVSHRLRHDGASNSTPYTRFSARTVGFGYNSTLELLGGRGLPDTAGLAALAQVMPGTGNAMPGTTADGSTYNLVINSPIHPDIRADVAGSLAVKFPSILAQPGPGVNTTSLRDFNFALTVSDSLSLVTATDTDAAEVANNLTLNRIEFRSYPQIVD